ncbi:DUF6773 family protein [Streptococcus moroccensis]|uniref:Cbb3-type cytochrome oxidase subunit 3 n=1 Tax=Streptococcus moroccensis TaxID=1451356 RepID=A0ABT9YP50_9STRE|nr:DUF6773 family protein [Streptococcus moroccensis]MDQ0221550.1 cbb3-type cytochrome oxidase subunit 3 [Streptococcus moroccensis]
MNEPIKQSDRANRQISMHQQIMTEMVYLLILILLGSVIVKMFIYDWELVSYVTELICLGVAILYSLVRHIRLGVNIAVEKTGGWKVALFSSVLLTGVFAIFQYQAKERQYVNPWDTTFLTVVGVFFLAVLLVQLVLQLLIYYRKRQKKAALEAQYKQVEETLNKTLD